jgi:glycosyltransferase involved in cell wall biosynthesis
MGKAMRLAVYTDYPYHRAGEEVYAERAFALFLARLASHFERFSVIGRLAPPSERGRYALGERVELVPLPYYARLSEPLPVMKALAGSIRQYWRALGDSDCVWLLGPHPIAFLFAAAAWLRRKRVVLGVREDLPEYVRNRHPGRRPMLLLAWILDRAFRALGRFCAVVAVGPSLADHYRRSRRLLQLTVSLVDESEIVAPESKRLDGDGVLKVLSVGRIDAEKNPLMLADVLARLVEEDPRWRLIVCGEGSLSGALDARLRELGVDDHAELRGYVSQDGGLKSLYGECQMLLHVSWTEGLPQVLYEAFAAALPVVATDVGGVRKAAADAVTLIPAGDPAAAAEALRELSEDSALRRSRIDAGHDLVKAATIQTECSRVAEFLSAR